MMTNSRRGPVVVGIDGTAEATRAGIYGAWEAKRHQVPLRLVYAHRPYAAWGAPTLADDGDRTWGYELPRRAEKDITAVHGGVTVEIVVVDGSPAAALLDEARQASL